MSHYDDIESEGVLNPEYFRQLEREEQQERARRMLATKDDPVNHPKHYTSHASGIECIQITRHMSFCLGNALKYIWRAGKKANEIEDLKKAVWYINQEIERLEND